MSRALRRTGQAVALVVFAVSFAHRARRGRSGRSSRPKGPSTREALLLMVVRQCDQPDRAGPVLRGGRPRRVLVNVVVAPDFDVNCTIPAGMPIVASPADHRCQTDRREDRWGAAAAVDADLAAASDVFATLDDQALDVNRGSPRLALPDAPGRRFLRTPGPRPRQSPPHDGGLGSLDAPAGAAAPRSHTLVLSDTFDKGTPDEVTLTGTFHITVAPKHHHHH